MKLFIGAISNDFGIHIHVCKSQDELDAKIYSYVCEYWNEVAGLENVINGSEIPEEPYEDKEKAIEAYFSSHQDMERCEVQIYEVTDKEITLTGS